MGGKHLVSPEQDAACEEDGGFEDVKARIFHTPPTPQTLSWRTRVG
jgi:hypothetical protein